VQMQSAQPVRTFAIGFHEKGYNEAEHATALAPHLGTAHTELYVTADDALAVVPALADLYDAPFADSSQIPTSSVPRTAPTRVHDWRRQCERVPGPLRRAMGALMGASTALPGRGAWRGKVGKLGELLRADTRGDFYRQFVSYWADPGRVVKGGVEPPSLFEQP